MHAGEKMRYGPAARHPAAPRDRASARRLTLRDMRYFIDHDQGDSIRGWIVPDNPLAISRVVVSVEGRRVADVAASLTDETFKRNGWHATGQCTFVLTAAEVPGLPNLPRVELYDVDTNVLIYRRAPPDGQVPLRVMLINTGIEPETAPPGGALPAFPALLFRHPQAAGRDHDLRADRLGRTLGLPVGRRDHPALRELHDAGPDGHGDPAPGSLHRDGDPHALAEGPGRRRRRSRREAGAWGRWPRPRPSRTNTISPMRRASSASSGCCRSRPTGCSTTR